MNQKELKELIDFLIEKDISEFELERGDVKVRIKRGADARPLRSSHMRYRWLPVPMAASPGQTSSFRDSRGASACKYLRLRLRQPRKKSCTR